MTNRGTDHRLRSGTQAVVDVTTTYAISAITVPSDGLADADFYVVNGELSIPIQPTRISGSADGSEGDDGPVKFDWVFDYFSMDMATNFLTAAGLLTTRSAPVTVMTYDELNNAKFVQCTIHRPLLPGPDAQYWRDGYNKIRFRFTNGIIIT